MMLENKTLKIVISVLFLMLLTSCATKTNNSNAETETYECRIAKSEYQMCYGNCLMTTPGAFLQAAGICGNSCMKQMYDMKRVCR